MIPTRLFRPIPLRHDSEIPQASNRFAFPRREQADQLVGPSFVGNLQIKRQNCILTPAVSSRQGLVWAGRSTTWR